jgi:FlaA1/EpsC-like NDP-sugar epimerase
MGATKRFAELVLAELHHQKSGTSFSSVRFGNVLGSSGSVIPIFRRQISAGGPVRITHPDITRFFMSIPEAAGLVLQSAWQSRGGEVFVLDMGEPVKIVDLARQMIELSGLEPDEDIKIEFTGLRPGEKLFEEPIHKNENISSTAHPKILMLSNVKMCLDAKIIDDLLKLVSDSSCWEAEGLKDWLSSKIPEYKIWKN